MAEALEVEALVVVALQEVGKLPFVKKSYILLLLFISCNNFGQLSVVSDLTQSLNEVSGIEMVANSDLIWMINDSGNASEIYGLSQSGEIQKVVTVNANNKDWEDLATDGEGNLFIGDFGNNSEKRKKLTILKIKNIDLINKKKVEAQKITFKYPKLVTLKKQVSFDAEAFVYYQNAFYIFTKSRNKKKRGQTFLFKVPNEVGKHTAEFIEEFSFCNAIDCRITAADISSDGTKIVLLNHKAIFELSGFKKDRFFSGIIKEIPLNHSSQKEGICFQKGNALFITDEYSRYTKGNLYEFMLKN